MFKFIDPMTCENETVIRKLSNFVYKAFFENDVACINSI